MDYDNIASVALGFVLEDDMWPVFLEWCRETVVSEQGRQWLAGPGPDINQIRQQWLGNCSDPRIRNIGKAQ